MERVLFISYFFEPYEGVGAKRVSYWAKNISIVDNNIQCDVITATDPGNLKFETIKNVYYVKNTNRKDILSTIIKDEGLTWKKDLIDFFKYKRDLPQYNTIIISGGPFMHFSISKYLKKRFNCKVILDFRDPFANNPRFSYVIKDKIKSYYENKFTKDADYVINVNKYCSDILKCKDKSKKVIIENGYDETVLNIIEKNSKDSYNFEKLAMIYAGKIYSDFEVKPFMNVITSEKYIKKVSFYYVGNDTQLLEKYSLKENVFLLGRKEYEDTLKEIDKCNTGLIFTGGKPFESTTKIFDYIGLRKNIFIITEGPLKTGNLNYISDNLQGVFWCKNDERSISQCIDEILLKKDIKKIYDNKSFSREFGLIKLISLINRNI